MPGAWDLYRGRSFILHGCEQGHPLKREVVEETGHQMRKSILMYSRLSQHSSKGLVLAIVGVMSAGETIQTLQLQKHTFKPSCRVHTPKNCAKTLPLNGLMQTQKFRAKSLEPANSIGLGDFTYCLLAPGNTEQQSLPENCYMNVHPPT